VKNSQPVNVTSVLRENGKKEFQVDGQGYDRYAQHIGLLPAVIIVPDDVQIITGGSEERRRFLDTLFSQLDPLYLQELISYNKVLQQRNGYLKSLEDRRQVNHQLLDAYDQQLAKHGLNIFEKRKLFLAELLPLVHRFYTRIAGTGEQPGLVYESQLSVEPYAAALAKSRERDILSLRTNTGPHKDDLVFSLLDRAFKSEGSQGQRKSLLFALKLAEFETLKLHKGFAPILLLDDVFEKLDATRIQNLLTWVCLNNQGQIFITDTHPERFRENVNILGIKYQLLDI
jgi:DNA replication and repair protein RecF